MRKVTGLRYEAPITHMGMSKQAWEIEVSLWKQDAEGRLKRQVDRVKKQKEEAGEKGDRMTAMRLRKLQVGLLLM